MAFGDFTRLNTNLGALQAYNKLQETNSQMSMRQLRLATGKRINSAEDDSAGFSIASSLRSKIRGQAQASSNIGDAKSMLTVAEGSLESVMEILQTMKEKTVQAANDTMSSTERTAIDNQLTALSAEITDILGDSKFNNASLFTSSAFNFQVGEGASDSFAVTVGTMSVDQLGVQSGALDVSSASAATALLSTIDSAITTISNKVGSVGDSQKRLTFKQDAINIAINNNEAAHSRIMDADFATEQMEIAKLSILQQTGIASLAQANSSASAVLNLL
ncbi:MAG: flagellin [Rhodothermales bacterium]|nr:flagellin [Rhodothermales bacterium]